jgi:hypothetical protein
MSCLLAKVGGWRVLARSYGCSESFRGKRFYFRSAQFGAVSYGACLTFGSDPDGLYMAVLIPFRIAHPPLLVPWCDVACSKAHSWPFAQVALKFAQAPEVSVQISKRLADSLLRESGIAGDAPTGAG